MHVLLSESLRCAVLRRPIRVRIIVENIGNGVFEGLYFFPESMRDKIPLRDVGSVLRN